MSQIWTMAAHETGVEQKVDVVCLQEPPSLRDEVAICHPAYDIGQRKRVWMAVWMVISFGTKKWTNLSKNRVGDAIIVDIT